MNEPRKKLLYLITKSNWGGAQKYLLTLAESASRDPGFSVAVGLGGTGLPGAPAGILRDKLRSANIRTIFIPSLSRDMAGIAELRSFLDVYRLLRKESPDIVHMNSSKIGGIGSLAARLAGVKKIVYTAHGFAWNEPRPRIEKLAIKIASWFTILFCTDVIVITERDKKEVKRWPLAGHKLHLIYNGIIPVATEANSDIRTAFPPHAVIAGTIAELHPNKGLLCLVEAASHLPDTIGIAIIGEGEQKALLQEEVRKRNLTDKVRFFGFVPAARALPNFDIFVLPSVKEGLPFAILEAGSTNKAVVASAVGGVPEIIKHGENGMLVPAGNPQELSRAIIELAENETKRNALAERLHKTVAERFSLERMSAATFATYSTPLLDSIPSSRMSSR